VVAQKAVEWEKRGDNNKRVEKGNKKVVVAVVDTDEMKDSKSKKDAEKMQVADKGDDKKDTGRYEENVVDRVVVVGDHDRDYEQYSKENLKKENNSDVKN
jgi:hypothetical protein